ncbi:MAG: hypothetical protein ABR585_15940 [Gemmatimonadaceae bacterium]
MVARRGAAALFTIDPRNRQLPGGAARDTSYKTAQDILEKNPQLDGIFAINDPTAFGAIAALEKAGFRVLGSTPSPILGPAGNREFLLAGRLV